MKDKSCNKVSEELLQELWTNRLPQQIKAILSCSTATLAEQVTMADKIHETMDTNSIQALSNQQQKLLDSDFNKKFCKLEDMIESLQTDINKSRSRTSSPWRNRSSTRSNNRTKPNNQTTQNSNNWCWYHKQFQNKADKCDDTMDPPCNFKNYKPKYPKN